jgi:ATP-binding cassette subfamily B protein
VFAVALLACLTIAAEAVAKGQLSVGGFVLTSVYMLQLVRPLETLGMAARDLARAKGFMRPLIDILAEPPEAWTERSDCAAAKWRAPASAPSIRFENVSFGYDSETPVIAGLDLEIPAGRTTAIVGRSGCGKSSLVRLLLRLHEPQEGRILIDGHPIESVPTAELRAMIGFVPQEAGLLQASVRNNIALGRPKATSQNIESATRRAQLHHLVDALPRGYDTPLGERGQTLSGGERQRLAIARAMLRKPLIYLLDEPTSMLDGRTEAAILPALRELTLECTTLVIAHRLSTIMDADQIVVLEDGRVQERGQHAELLARQGVYAQLWHQQTGGQA